MHEFQSEYQKYKQLIDRRLRKLADEGDRKPRSLSVPVRYVLSGGGKRIRPVLLLLAFQAVGGKFGRSSRAKSNGVLDAAIAIEALHNFTLVHDDIMDNATSRRGRATVHTKWDQNTAILVGDELVALAYRSLLKTKGPRVGEIVQVFTEGMLDVCEGQGFDKDIQYRNDVTLEDYLKMIEKKTGRMVSVALEIGALIGSGTRAEVSALRKYGTHIGRAFQIQDDLLDIAGGRRFGKKIGGDLLEGKKTYLLLKAYRLAQREDRHFLERMMNGRGVRTKEVGRAKKMYEKYGVIESTRKEVRRNVGEAQRALRRLRQSRAKAMLNWFAEMLRDRRF